MLPQEADQFAIPAALGEARRALVTDRTTGLKQFGGGFALIQIDGFGLMPAGCRFGRRPPGGRVVAALGECRGDHQAGQHQGRNQDQSCFDLAAKDVSCPG